ncbi:MAG: DUF5671 domain-containing protein [Candidatus Paceibacterota bacterium]|jgi:hypothetical protein
MDPNSVVSIAKPKMGPKDFFLNVAAAIVMYVSAGSLIALLFSTIDYWLIDTVNYYSYGFTGGMRFAISSLIVLFPVYLWLMTLIRKDADLHPEKREVGIHKVIVYLTLFLAGGLIIGDLIAVINVFLSGEIATRFILKALVILIVGALIFSYYLYDLRKGSAGDRLVRNAYKWGTAAIVLVSIVVAFLAVGSPMTARQARFDDQRVSDLQNIQWQVISYWQSKGRLPTALTDLEDSISGWKAPKDPETKVDYSFGVNGSESLNFKLCGKFALDNSKDTRRANDYSYGTNENWQHSAGDFCFARTIDKDRYPVNVRTVPMGY